MNAEEGGVDEEEEVSAGEIILVVSDDGLCHGGGIGFVGEVGNSISLLKGGKAWKKEGEKDGKADEEKHDLK